MITQEQIDQHRWFHDFDFPGGLVARSADRANSVFQRLRCSFLRDQLDKIEFAGKTVIDVGCWDGYFSFTAEERGAHSVLAVDDFSQNWGRPECFYLARALKKSSVQLRPDVSVYELSRIIQQQFDILLFFGVFYHLHSPYSAFAELRALCHANSLVLIEGLCIRDEQERYAECHLDDPVAQFIPTTRLLKEMLGACYFEVVRTEFLGDVSVTSRLSLAPPSELLQMAHAAIETKRSNSGKSTSLPAKDRALFIAKPFVGRNSFHQHKPPFGLHRFDSKSWD